MATYVPNASQITEPLESRTVESAALEFRTLKALVNSLDAAIATDDLTVLRVPETSIAVLPAIVSRAGKVLGFDAEGDPAMVAVAGATDPSLRNDLAASSGASLVGYLPAGTGAVAKTAQAKLREFPTANDNAIIVSDGITDNTAGILSAAVGSGKKFMIIPPNTKYDRVALLSAATLPDDVVFLDFSGINDNSAPGESTKHFGIVSKDSAPDDTHWSIDSGHHAIMALNNYGTGGTTSASERKGSLIWNAGQYELGAADKRGFRGAGLLQFTKESSSDFWVYQMRSLAPWVSVAGQYEIWAAGQVISGAGVYRTNDSQHYVSASAGTTGGTPPTHTTGTVTDGGVLWTWVDSGDRSVFSFRQDGRVLLGTGSYGETWQHKVSAADPAGVFTWVGEATGASKTAQLKLNPTGGDSEVSPQPFLRAEDGVGLRIMTSDASSDIARFSDSGGLVTKETGSVFTANAATGTTPNVIGIGTLLVNNGSATSITALIGASDGQIVHLVFQNANTTMVSSATLLMTGSVNVTPSAWSVITMLKVPAGTSDRWIELSRSIK